MKVLFRDVRSGKRKAAVVDLKSIARRELEQAVDKQVKPALVKSHEMVVANWKHKPGFASKKYLKPDRIEVGVFPTGEHKQIWIYVDRGTKPHTITAKRAPLLKFRYPYKSKTLARPARTVSGGGTYGPNWASKVSVQHPGSEARNFSKEIAEDIKPGFKREIENAFRRAARKVQE